MDESILLRELGQVSSEDAGVVFRAYLRGCVRQMLTDVMAAEVTELCGAKHRPSVAAVFVTICAITVDARSHCGG